MTSQPVPTVNTSINVPAPLYDRLSRVIERKHGNRQAAILEAIDWWISDIEGVPCTVVPGSTITKRSFGKGLPQPAPAEATP